MIFGTRNTSPRVILKPWTCVPDRLVYDERSVGRKNIPGSHRLSMGLTAALRLRLIPIGLFIPAQSPEPPSFFTISGFMYLFF